ncbi:MAG: HAMP domain-containing histidine kinase, partial [Chitinophagaceae bacterium]|nr:HAMP domain-containing histidine kinase [Chitinophagaceae bacterium]
NASHEFRTPIATILGEAELAISAPRTAEELKTAITIIHKQAEKMRHLSNNLLNLAQTGFDGKRQEWKMIRVDELMWNVKESVEEITNSCSLYMRLDKLPESPEDLLVKGNEQLLKLAISNIVLNGCKYSGNKPVNLTIMKVEEYIHIVVEDEGIGIPQLELDHIFEPFFRASNSLKFEGYGIGLPLSLNIIRRHHGMIKVSSSEGRGTKVVVALPVSKE